MQISPKPCCLHNKSNPEPKHDPKLHTQAKTQAQLGPLSARPNPPLGSYPPAAVGFPGFLRGGSKTKNADQKWTGPKGGGGGSGCGPACAGDWKGLTCGFLLEEPDPN